MDPTNKENDEATKLKKRWWAVQMVKDKVEYIVTTSLDDQPQGPDPYAKMSKRQWEEAMKNWRHQLRAKASELGMHTSIHEACAKAAQHKRDMSSTKHAQKQE